MGRTSLVLLLSLVGVGAASAKEDRSAEGKRYYMRAVQLFDQEKYAEAAENFEKAYEIAKKGNLLFNIAVAHERHGDLEKAHESYGRFLEEVWDAPNAGDVRKLRDKLLVEIKKSYPQVTVNTDPQGADIYLDDRTTGAQGKSPATFAVEPGKHRIFAEKEGHASENVEVDVKKGTSPSFSVSLKKSKGKGKVKLVVAPKGAVVTVNGEELGTAPFAKVVSMQEGTYWVTATAADHEPWTGTLLVHPGKTAKLSVSLRSTIPPEPFPYDDAALYSGVGGAGALLVGGLVAALAYSAHSDLEKDQDQGQPLDADDVDAGRTYWVSAQVLGGLGALGLLTSGVFYYLGADDDPASAGPDRAAPAARRPTDLGLTPVVGIGGADEPGLLLRGTF